MIDKKYFKRFLVIAYWNMYTEMLTEPEENGSHILPFMAMTSVCMGFFVGYLMLFEFVTRLTLPGSLDLRIVVGTALGAYITYIFFVKDNKFKKAKLVLEELDDDKKKSVCTTCGLMTVAVGMSPFILMFVVAFFYMMR